MRAITSRLPEAKLAADLLRRGALVWVALRLLLALASLLMKADPIHLTPAAALALIIHLTPAAALALIVVTGGVRLIGGRWRNEPYFLSNLGVSPTTAVAFSTAPAALGESLIALFLPG